MDTDSGRFVDDREAKEWMKRLAVGEVVKLKDEEFEVLEIGDRTVLLKLLSSDDRIRRAFCQAMVTGDRAQEIMRESHNALNRHERRRLERLQR